MQQYIGINASEISANEFALQDKCQKLVRDLQLSHAITYD